MLQAPPPLNRAPGVSPDPAESASATGRPTDAFATLRLHSTEWAATATPAYNPTRSNTQPAATPPTNRSLRAASSGRLGSRRMPRSGRSRLQRHPPEAPLRSCLTAQSHRLSFVPIQLPPNTTHQPTTLRSRRRRFPQSRSVPLPLRSTPSFVPLFGVSLRYRSTARAFGHRLLWSLRNTSSHRIPMLNHPKARGGTGPTAHTHNVGLCPALRRIPSRRYARFT